MSWSGWDDLGCCMQGCCFLALSAGCDVTAGRQQALGVCQAGAGLRASCVLPLSGGLTSRTVLAHRYGVDENGWPGIFEQLCLKKGQKVRAGGVA